MSRWHEQDFETENEADDPRGRSRGGIAGGLARLGFIVGAIAVVGGLVWFGFRHSAEVTDEASLPIIKADPRPLKSRPVQPGGMEVPNQDKLVFDRLDPDAAPPMIERLLPPPETPMPRPVAPLTPPPAADTPTGRTASRTAIDTVMAPPPMAQSTGLTDDMAPPPPPAVAPPKPSPAPADTAKPAPTASGTAKPTPTSPAKPTPAVAKPPPLNPATPPKPAATAKPAPVTLTGNNVRIQVGAVPREADAQTEWKRLQARHRELLGNLPLIVVRADLGEKGVYFRLQAGPIDEGRAHFICDQLKGQNVGCQIARN